MDTIIQTNYLDRVAATTKAAAAVATVTATATLAAKNTASITTTCWAITTTGSTVETQLDDALQLDFGERPRMNRLRTIKIVLHDRQQARQVG